MSNRRDFAVGITRLMLRPTISNSATDNPKLAKNSALPPGKSTSFSTTPTVADLLSTAPAQPHLFREELIRQCAKIVCFPHEDCTPPGLGAILTPSENIAPNNLILTAEELAD